MGEDKDAAELSTRGKRRRTTCGANSSFASHENPSQPEVSMAEGFKLGDAYNRTSLPSRAKRLFEHLLAMRR